MSKCPTCFEHLPPRALKLVCKGTCGPTRNLQASAARGYDVALKPILEPSGAGPDGSPTGHCTKCATTSEQEVCPTCYGEIPAAWRAAHVTCVAMSGARATGKSLMLGVAKAQLGLLVERHFSSTLRGIGDTDRYFYERYTRSLYEQRQILEPTARIADDQTTSRDPLIFSFAEPTAEGGRRNRILVLRDVAGEDLESLSDDDDSLSFFARADAVIALIDPLKVPAIRHMLVDIVPGDARLGGDGITVINNLLALMTNRVVGARTSVPLAVALSKFDTLQELRGVKGTEWARIMNRPGSPLQRDPSMRTARFDETDGDLLHFEVRALMEKLNSASLTAMIEETARHFRYFAVSALGASPQGELLHAGGIAPFRVLDPFKWALKVSA